ncbi:hypothetical protein QFC21_003327 [Naganishia friedmannii]|uniref:Uncharacterized protein n=1 Tax=Naganishia friedmannii TaxID=89922 RepID=A0ACC2VNW1_9TREE|nr:hypothetical protein QFC21_003327 [Naganishia friedmannii]
MALPYALSFQGHDEKARLLANAEPMGWSPLQNVVVEAKREGDNIVIKGYGVGEKGIPLNQIAVAFLRLPSGTTYEPTMDEHLTEGAVSSAAKWHKTNLDPAGDGKRWGWTLWQINLQMEDVRHLINAEEEEAAEGQIVVIVKASTYHSLALYRCHRRPDGMYVQDKALIPRVLSFLQSMQKGKSRLVGRSGICEEWDSTDGA